MHKKYSSHIVRDIQHFANFRYCCLRALNLTEYLGGNDELESAIQNLYIETYRKGEKRS
jgi:hypothetical protein